SHAPLAEQADDSVRPDPLGRAGGGDRKRRRSQGRREQVGRQVLTQMEERRFRFHGWSVEKGPSGSDRERRNLSYTSPPPRPDGRGGLLATRRLRVRHQDSPAP